MRISKDQNGHIIIDGEGQVVDTGIFVDCMNVTIINFVLDGDGHGHYIEPGEDIIEKRVNERIKEIVRERLALKDFIMEPLSKRFELLDLGE